LSDFQGTEKRVMNKKIEISDFENRQKQYKLKYRHLTVIDSNQE